MYSPKMKRPILMTELSDLLVKSAKRAFLEHHSQTQNLVSNLRDFEKGNQPKLDPYTAKYTIKETTRMEICSLD
jgi:hypothetical protein